MYHMTKQEIDHAANLLLKKYQEDQQTQLSTPPTSDHHSMPKTEIAKKFDQGKLEHNLLPKEALDAITEVLMFGKNKYGAFNWMKGEGLNWSRVYNACMRHLTAWNDGESLDKESSLDHIAHAACNLAFLLTYIRKGIGTDDRQISSTKE